MLNTLCHFSHKYGSCAEYVLAGGGNTSCKDENYLYIKGSGTALATIEPAGFVKMERAKLATMLTKEYPACEEEREAAVLADLMSARAWGEEAKRPSVETLLHDLFPQKFVLHVHPAKVNGLTCSVNGEKIVKEAFGDAVWVESTKPGYILAMLCKDKLDAYKSAFGKDASILFLQNHGIFFAADSEETLDAVVASVMERLDAMIKRSPDFTEVAYDADLVTLLAPAIRMLWGEGSAAVVKFTANKTVLEFAENAEKFANIVESFTPDHIVYCKAHPLFVEEATVDAVKGAFAAYVAKYGYKPKVVFVKGLGMFAVSDTVKSVATVTVVWQDALKIAVYAESFGGVLPMTEDLIDFIVNWEVESYRSKVSAGGKSARRIEGKIAIVTGSAQGFGKGIAEHMAAEGAYIVVADMNEAGAKATANELCERFGAGIAISVGANVSDEESVKAMVAKCVSEFGGLDVLVNNAGIVRAGSLEEMTKANFELVTAVNYTAYFICTKYASAVMKTQRAVCPDYLADIVEINSKSGLEGSNKNFAYAGSKFGGIGLTASFAMELAPFGIKVNAICPGNFLNGPLWSDPVKGLFVQYLNAGKVPGAKTIEDVRRFYEAKVPLNRGCEVIDVARAILHVIEQEYETGQAIPVTGGQVMLH